MVVAVVVAGNSVISAAAVVGISVISTAVAVVGTSVIFNASAVETSVISLAAAVVGTGVVSLAAVVGIAAAGLIWDASISTLAFVGTVKG
ncbi:MULTISPECIES: hypothetical protein [unclassified Microcoleus]|uniref:hypothetical protein n=1 Tax=unclassified Microcoleus TaxID=2642155 RepID=UPI002FD5DAEC